jgi:GNAT superfamily N-acetyltransferase
MHRLEEVDGVEFAELLRNLNAQDPARFPPLQRRHFDTGYWWLARGAESVIVGFAGMVPMVPFPRVGYLKRAYVSPEHRGHGLQLKFMRAREEKARALGWTKLVSECSSNPHSEANFGRTGYQRCDPEQLWGAPGSVFFEKVLE